MKYVINCAHKYNDDNRKFILKNKNQPFHGNGTLNLNTITFSIFIAYEDAHAYQDFNVGNF